jgi:putative methyltransferase (TIGR04325 family)
LNYAPILIFVYKRLWHTQKTIESLLKNEEARYSDVYIYSDGPKFESDQAKVLEVREYIKKVEGFANLKIIEREKNLGLSKSIISGVSEVLSQKKEIIVLEDDMLVSKYFLSYMNQALKLYEDESKVACIHAWNYPLKGDLPQTFFLRGADCWGWATWERAWKIFNSDGSELLNKIKEQKLEYEFDRKGAYPYTQMLEDQIQGKNDSWAIRWHASAFLADMYCLLPGRSLLQNIGLDGSGTHSGTNESLSPILNENKVDLKKIPIKQNEKVLLKIKKFYSRNSLPSKIGFIIKIMKKIFKLISHLKKIFNKENKTIQHEWFKGNYSSWEDALKDSKGYDSPEILLKVMNSLLKVKNGEAIYERDSIIFDKIQYSWPLLVALLFIATKNKCKLRVIDYGGSLGSSYYQNRNYLIGIQELEWVIIEQKNFVKIGNIHFQSQELLFFDNIEESITSKFPNVLLLSGVLQYLSNPLNILEYLLSLKIHYIIIDRTPFFINNLSDRITIQTTPKEIYDATYPAWFFNEVNFKNIFDKYGYKLKEEENSFESWNVNGDIAQNKFLFFELK